MKRFFSGALALVLCITMLAGCQNNNAKLSDEAVRAAVLSDFTKISEIPRNSGHMNAISSYLRSWAKENGLSVVRDKYYNIIISEPATKGYENAPLTILQAHMDTTIAVKFIPPVLTTEGAVTSEPSIVSKAAIVFDPLTDPVNVINNGETLTADGTSLGADSGIGIALAQYILKNSQNHGPLRVIFTANGETSMEGAQKIDPKYLEGAYLINLDWKDDTSIGIGSPGTSNYKMSRNISWVVPKNTVAYEITLHGLNGGPADLDLKNDGANAIKVIGDLLGKLKGAGIIFELASVNAGTSNRMIPTDATAVIVGNDSDARKLSSLFKDSRKLLKTTFGSVEKNYSYTIAPSALPKQVISESDSDSIISFLYSVSNGAQAVSSSDQNKAEGYSNIGTASTGSGDFISSITALTTTEDNSKEITSAHEAICSLTAMTYKYIGGTPILAATSKNRLVKTFSAIYRELYGKEPILEPAGQINELTLLAQKNPELETISIGPMIKYSETPSETVYLNTVTKPAKWIITFLAEGKE